MCRKSEIIAIPRCRKGINGYLGVRESPQTPYFGVLNGLKAKNLLKLARYGPKLPLSMIFRAPGFQLGLACGAAFKALVGRGSQKKSEEVRTYNFFKPSYTSI